MSPDAYWRHALDAVQRGLAPGRGAALAEAALEQLPGNPVFQAAARDLATDAPSEPPSPRREIDATALPASGSSSVSTADRWVEFAIKIAAVFVGFILLRLVPTVRAYGHWGLEYREVRPEGACAAARQGCCAVDIGDVASTTALYFWGDRCEEPGLSRDSTACDVVETGTLRVLGQACW